MEQQQKLQLWLFHNNKKVKLQRYNYGLFRKFISQQQKLQQVIGRSTFSWKLQHWEDIHGYVRISCDW